MVAASIRKRLGVTIRAVIPGGMKRRDGKELGKKQDVEDVEVTSGVSVGARRTADDR
jgi:hypothetical protein